MYRLETADNNPAPRDKGRKKQIMIYGVPTMELPVDVESERVVEKAKKAVNNFAKELYKEDKETAYMIIYLIQHIKTRPAE